MSYISRSYISGRRLSISALLLATALLPLTSHAAFWSPHVGVDYKYWDVEPAPQFDNLFPRVKYGFNAYAGTRINGFFGFDVGFEQSARKTFSQQFEGGELIFAVPEDPENQAVVNMRLRDVHVDLNFYWQVVKRVEVIFMLGAAYLHSDTHVYHYSSPDNLLVEYENTSHPKWSGRIGLGVQYNPVPCIGIKAMLSGDQVRRIEFLGQDANENFYDIFPYHKAVAFNIGVVYSFSDARRKAYIPAEDPPFF